jgi:micrococcal nuclease
MKKILPLLLIFCLVACGNSTQKAKEPANEEEKSLLQQNEPVAGRFYPIKKFVDGDTFWIDDSTATGIKVRLIGMDTPESRNTRNKQKHPMGKEVADYVEQMLTGQRVRLELDVQHRDRYGRLLAYVFLEDGTHLNAHLLEKGYALLMTVPPNVKYADEFYALQVKAREAKLGLWNGEDIE